MKLRMEFEENDLRDMLIVYFDRSGFKILNLEDICKKFNDAFPKGLYVNVSTETVTKDTPSDHKESEDAVDTVAEAPTNQEGTESGPLSFNELMDPSYRDDVPQIRNLLQESKKLEQSKKDILDD